MHRSSARTRPRCTRLLLVALATGLAPGLLLATASCVFELGDVKPLADAGADGAAGGSGGAGGGPGAGAAGGAGGGLGGAIECSFARNCLLQDDFDERGIKAVWQPFEGDAGVCEVDETNGELVAKPSTVTGYCGYTTPEPDVKDARSATLTVRVGSATKVVGSETLVSIIDHDLSTNAIHISVAGTGRLVVDGPTDPPFVDVAYEPEAHRWWRLVESAGTIEFSTSADGIEWASPTPGPATAPTPPWFDGVQLTLAAGTFGDVRRPPGEAHFDCFSLCPSE